jgi:uncharacterized protein
MVIAVLQVSLRLPSRDLKARRTIVRSVVERLRNRFNASVAEVGELNNPGLATIAVACVSNESAHADSQLQSIARAIEEWRLDAEVINIETELIPYS